MRAAKLPYASIIIFLSFIISIVVGCSQPLQPTSQTYQLWAEPEAGRQPLLDAINHAQHEIDVVMYLFTDKRLAWALKNAAKRGVTVHLLIEKSPNQYDEANQWLNHFFAHIPNLSYQWVPYDKQLNYYHQKTLIIDQQTAYVMTLNFTHSSFYKKAPERNFILKDQNTTDVTTIQHIFDADWQHQIPRLPQLTNIALSPANSRTQLLNFITQTKTQLSMYAIGLSDYQLIGALAKAAQRGVRVEIFWDGKLNDKAASYLRKHGVQLRQVADNTENHAKLMISDQQKILIGSINFTENSLDHNRELSVIVPSTPIAHQATEIFEQDWS